MTVSSERTLVLSLMLTGAAASSCLDGEYQDLDFAGRDDLDTRPSRTEQALDAATGGDGATAPPAGGDGTPRNKNASDESLESDSTRKDVALSPAEPGGTQDTSTAFDACVHTASETRDAAPRSSSAKDVVDASSGSSVVRAAIDASTDLDSSSGGRKDAGVDAGEFDAVDGGCSPRYTASGCSRTRFVDVIAGKVHSCGLRGDGTVRCWGNDAFGQVSQAPTNAGFKSLHSGGVYSCAMRLDDTVLCWGYAATGVPDAPLSPLLSLVTGWDAACGEELDGVFQCWGNDTGGKYSPRPSAPVLDLGIGWEQGCAILLDGSITCWGADEAGQASPPSGDDYVALSLASWHGCAQHTDQTIDCWGAVENWPTHPITSMNSRGLDTCVIAPDDQVHCFGSGNARDVPPLTAQRVAVGDGHACALLFDDSITCWGDTSEGATLVPE